MMTYSFERRDRNYFYCDNLPCYLINKNHFWQPYSVIYKGRVFHRTYDFVDAVMAVLRAERITGVIFDFEMEYEARP